MTDKRAFILSVVMIVSSCVQNARHTELLSGRVEGPDGPLGDAFVAYAFKDVTGTVILGGGIVRTDEMGMFQFPSSFKGAAPFFHFVYSPELHHAVEMSVLESTSPVIQLKEAGQNISLRQDSLYVLASGVSRMRYRLPGSGALAAPEEVNRDVLKSFIREVKEMRSVYDLFDARAISDFNGTEIDVKKLAQRIDDKRPPDKFVMDRLGWMKKTGAAGVQTIGDMRASHVAAGFNQLLSSRDFWKSFSAKEDYSSLTSGVYPLFVAAREGVLPPENLRRLNYGLLLSRFSGVMPGLDPLAVDWVQGMRERFSGVEEMAFRAEEEWLKDGFQASSNPDSPQEVLWDEKAAARGFNDARLRLSMRYQFGRGVQVNPEKAYYWAYKRSRNSPIDNAYKESTGLQLSEAVRKKIENEADAGSSK